MLLTCLSLHLFPGIPKASHPNLLPLPPLTAAVHHIASQDPVCPLPCSSVLPAYSCRFSLQQVAWLLLNKLKK